MEQRDLLRDEIEQLGKVLAKILSKFLALKESAGNLQAIQACNQMFRSELDVNIEELTQLKKSQLKEYFEKRHFTPEHLELFADYYTELAQSKISEDRIIAKEFLKKTYEILDIADEISNTFSLSRLEKKQRLKDRFRF